MPCIGPDRGEVLDALDVVPHPVAVDEARAALLGDARACGRRRGRARRSACASAACRATRARPSRTRSWLPPMPPLATTTEARLDRELADLVPVAGLAALGAHPEPGCCPTTPTIAPSRRISSSTRCRNRSSTSPASTPSSTVLMNGSSTPGPVPQTMWKRGTELPWPVAVYPPRSGPADDREELDALGAPASRASRPRRRRGRPRPTPGPSRLRRGRTPRCRTSPGGRVRGCRARPVGAARGSRQEEAAERPVRLAAEARLGLLLDDHDALAGLHEFGGGDEARRAPRR